MSFTKITQTELNQKGATTQPDRPTISAQDLKRVFDSPAKEVVAPAYNRLIDELEATTGAGNIGAVAPTGRTGATTQAVINSVSNDLATLEGSVAQVIADDHTHANKALLDTYTQTEADLADAVSKKHSHSNKSLLDTYTQTEANIADAVSKKHDHSNKSLLDTYTQTEANLSDAVSKKHVHSNKALLDTYTQTDADVADAVDKKHAHSNKSLLDTYDQTNANIKSAVDNTHSHSNKAVLDELSDTDNELYYKGAPVGGGGGGTSNYNNLSNKPQINSTTLSGNKSLADLGIQGALTEGDGINITGTTIALDLGMLTGSNLTKAVAGKDIKDALDAKQPTLTFDNTPTKNSTNPVKSGGVYDAISPKAPISLLKDTVGWVGKNMLPIPSSVVTKTVGEVTFTVTRNSKGEVTEIDVDTNGQTTTTFRALDFFSWEKEILPEGNWILSDVNGSANAYTYINRKKGESGTVNYNIGTSSASSVPVNVDYNTYDYFVVGVGVPSGKVADHVKLYPMLRDASITDSTYEPYHKPVEDWYWENNAKTGVHNLLENKATTQTLNTIVWTVDATTKKVTAGNQTASANSLLVLNDITLPAGSYKISGCPNYGSNDIFFQVIKSGEIDLKQKNGEPLFFSLSAEKTLTCRLVIASGLSGGNKVWEPMITLASDTDSTYQPYAMTNRELTEKVAVIGGGLLPMLLLDKIYGRDGNTINIDKLDNPKGYMIRFEVGSDFAGTFDTATLGTAGLLIGFSRINPSNELPFYGVQMAMGFSSAKIALRIAPYNGSGASWGAWKYITAS